MEPSYIACVYVRNKLVEEGIVGKNSFDIFLEKEVKIKDGGIFGHFEVEPHEEPTFYLDLSDGRRYLSNALNHQVERNWNKEFYEYLNNSIEPDKNYEASFCHINLEGLSFEYYSIPEFLKDYRGNRSNSVKNFTLDMVDENFNVKCQLLDKETKKPIKLKLPIICFTFFVDDGY